MADDEPRELVDRELPRRPRCAVFIAMSLDGFIARPDGDLDWLEPMHLDGEDYGYQAFVDAVDAWRLGTATHLRARRKYATP